MTARANRGLRCHDGVMEKFSRTALAGLAVGASGPGAAMLAIWLLAPSLVAISSPGTSGGTVEQAGNLFVGLVLGTLLVLPIAYVAGLAATFAALRGTACPRPHVALLLCLLLSVPWLGMLSVMDVDITAFLVLAGMLPAGIRVGFAYLEPRHVDYPAQTPTGHG